jgi:hypothetical protein
MKHKQIKRTKQISDNFQIQLNAQGGKINA